MTVSTLASIFSGLQVGVWPMNAVHGTGAAFYPRCQTDMFQLGWIDASLKNDIFDPGGGDLGGGVIFFHPYFGKWSNLTHIFFQQLQLVIYEWHPNWAQGEGLSWMQLAFFSLQVLILGELFAGLLVVKTPNHRCANWFIISRNTILTSHSLKYLYLVTGTAATFPAVLSL